MLKVSNTVSLCECVSICICTCMNTVTDCKTTIYKCTPNHFEINGIALLLTYPMLISQNSVTFSSLPLIQPYGLKQIVNVHRCTLVHCKLDAEIHGIVHFSTFNWYYKFSKLQPIGHDVCKKWHHIAPYIHTYRCPFYYFAML